MGDSSKTEPLAEYHRGRKEKSQQAILDAMRTIDAEIAQRGYYYEPDNPDKPRRLSVQEVQRRAGVSEAYLRNARHKDLKKQVQNWVKGHKKESAVSKPDGAKARRDTIEFFEQALAEISSQAISWRKDLATKDRRIKALEAQILNMSSGNSDNVVPMPPRRTE